MAAEQTTASSQEILRQQGEYAEKVRSILAQRYEEIPRALVHSFGCQQNVADGEKIKGLLAQMGYGFTDSLEEADLVLYNTCAVRENAQARVFGNVGALKHYKRRKPAMIIGLCGCMTQQEEVSQKLKRSYPYVDLVFGTNGIHRLPEFLYRTLTEKKRVIDHSDPTITLVEGMPIQRDGKVKAWLPIMYGCDNFCTYCIVPYVRGRERSREPQAILKEAQELVQQGYKDITLLGQNVNSYGKGLAQPINFAQLLRQIDAIPGDFRIRFMTSHPKDCTRELIDTIAQSRKICHHLHLPVQSGSDRILKLMNRHYDVASYLELIRYAREKMPDVTFTSDIIVGFPGETYEDFQQTLDLVRQVRYASLFTFIYSVRPGTRAAQMEDPISQEEKGKWFRELLHVQEEIGQAQYNRLVGKTCRVLVDGEGRDGEGYVTGRTESNIIVNLPGGKELIGQFVDVAVEKALNWAVFGHSVDHTIIQEEQPMDIIEMAKELGKAIQQDAAYLNFAAARQNCDEDEALQQLIGEFNLKRIELNQEVVKEDKDTDKLMALDQEVKNLYGQIMANSNFDAFNQGKEELDHLMSYINAILQATVNGDNPDLVEDPALSGGCSGNCSGCSGCH